MSKKLLFLILSCIALLCLTTTVSADVGGSNQVTIYVKSVTSGPFISDDSVIESPVEGAAVAIIEGNEQIYTATTDSDGKILVNLEDGVYNFSVSATGFEDKITQQAITESTTMTIFLTPPISMLYYAFIVVIIIIVGIFVFVEYKSKKRKRRKHEK